MIRAWAPSNIAIVKYMGKSDPGLNLPANSSLSMTLNHLRTEVELRSANEQGFTWNPDLPEGSRGTVPELQSAEIQRFVAHAGFVWKAAKKILEDCGIEPVDTPPSFVIRAANTFPKGAGIASSASSFAAVTLATTAARAASLERFRETYTNEPGLRRSLSAVSRQGSGSSCRSFEGPWVEWSDAAAEALPSRLTELTDLVLLFQKSPKAVSSSEAHRRVIASPLWERRAARANARAHALKTLLGIGDLIGVAGVAWEEAWEMHSLFHTSHPPFTYWEPGTVEFLRWVAPEIETSAFPPIVTLDAGANVHVLVPSDRSTEWKRKISEKFSRLEILEDRQGTGADLC